MGVDVCGGRTETSCLFLLCTLVFCFTFISLALLPVLRRGNYYEPELYTHLWRSAPIFATFLGRDTVQRLIYYYLHTVLASTAIGL